MGVRLTNAMVSFDPNRPDFAPYGLTCVRWSPSPMRRPDHHNEIELNLLHTGWVTYLLGGRKVTIVPGRLSVFWAAIPHQIIDYGDEPDYFVATIPFAWFLQCRLPDRFVQPLLHGEVVSEPDATRAPFDFKLLGNWVSDLKAAGDDLKHAVLLEMHARLMRLALTLPATLRSPVPLGRRKASLELGGLNKVEQMACLIAQRYLEHLSVEDIGKAVGLHPNYAMGLFKRTFGTTLVDYLTHHRVSHAQRLLATTDQKIVEVAMESGFNSISRFNEAFRRACGCSPREYRQRHMLSE
jgi:AraC family transcriptional regulator, melibiose operon regulatory protein